MLEWLTEDRIQNIYTRTRIGIMQLYSDNMLYKDMDDYEPQTASLCQSYISDPDKLIDFLDVAIEGIKKDNIAHIIGVNKDFIETAYEKPLTKDEESALYNAIALDIDSVSYDFLVLKYQISEDFLYSVSDIISFYSSQYTQVIRYIFYEINAYDELVDIIKLADIFAFDDAREFLGVIFEKEWLYDLPAKNIEWAISEAMKILTRRVHAERDRLRRLCTQSSGNMIEKLIHIEHIDDDVPAKYYCDYLDDKPNEDDEEEDE